MLTFMDVAHSAVQYLVKRSAGNGASLISSWAIINGDAHVMFVEREARHPAGIVVGRAPGEGHI